MDFASAKNCVVYCATSSGLVMTSLILRRVSLAISAVHSIAKGSVVATTSSLGVISTGRIWTRAAYEADITSATRAQTTYTGNNEQLEVGKKRIRKCNKT